ncbi:MAG: DUF4339 domain-containing protein [Pseudomonadota bacterium]
MGVAEWFFLQGAKEAGPFTRDQIQSLFSSGAITEETHLWRPGYSDWRPMTAFSEFEIEPPRPRYEDKQRRRVRSLAAPRQSDRSVAIASDQVLAANASRRSIGLLRYVGFTMGILALLGCAGLWVWLNRPEWLQLYQ